MKRILLFIGTLQTGGAEQRLALLAKSLFEKQVNVEVITLFSGGSNWEKLQKITALPIISLYPARAKNKFNRIMQYAYAPILLGRLIRAHRKVGVLVYSFLEMTNLIAWLASRGKRYCRLVWAMCSANMDVPELWKLRLIEKVCGFISKSVPLVLANSQAGMVHAQKVYGYHPRKFQVVRNGIDLDLYYPDLNLAKAFRDELNLGDDIIVVTICGRVTTIKGFDLFFKAAKQIGDLSKLVFVCVGPDGGEMQALQALTKDLGIADRVKWLGARSDMNAIFNGSDVVCSCSRGEGTSNVICEAIAVGVPCVVTDVGDSAYIVGEQNWVVPVEVNAIARGLSQAIILSSEQRAELRDKNRQRAMLYLSKDRYIQETLQALLEVD